MHGTCGQRRCRCLTLGLGSALYTVARPDWLAVRPLTGPSSVDTDRISQLHPQAVVVQLVCHNSLQLAQATERTFSKIVKIFATPIQSIYRGLPVSLLLVLSAGDPLLQAMTVTTCWSGLSGARSLSSPPCTVLIPLTAFLTRTSSLAGTCATWDAC